METMETIASRIQRRRERRRQRIAGVARVAVERRTYTNILYLLAAFPLGTLYFVVLVTAISIGIGTAIIGVGLVLLALTLLCWYGFAAFERQLVMWWLGVEIPPMGPANVTYPTLWKRFLAHLRNPVTWKSLAYLFMEFPFGMLSFTLVITLVSVSLGLILYPLAYIGETLFYNGSGGPFVSHIGFGVTINGQIEAGPLLLFLLCAVAGVALGIASLYVCNGLAWAWGRFAVVTLGMSDTSRRLTEARAVADRERQRAARADQSRKELIVNVSHELRTPIASIRGHAESLLMPEGERPADADPHAYLSIIARESERLSALVDDLLALARADAGELRLDLRPVAVGEVIEEVYASLALLARRDRQVTLVRNVAPHLPLALADRDRLAQVLLNLTRNAITYTPAGGIVSLDAQQTDAYYVTLTVSDTGMGIPPEDLERIFDRFYRADASRARASGGFGLGLSIVRDLVHAMGGAVTAESTLNEGSRFHVYLRLAQQRP